MDTAQARRRSARSAGGTRYSRGGSSIDPFTRSPSFEHRAARQAAGRVSAARARREVQALTPVRPEAVERLAQLIPRLRPALGELQHDDAGVVRLEALAIEPRRQLAKQRIRARTTPENAQLDRRLRHEGLSLSEVDRYVLDVLPEDDPRQHARRDGVARPARRRALPAAHRADRPRAPDERGRPGDAPRLIGAQRLDDLPARGEGL